ncbi:MAG TPA: hypothetical protein VLA12_18385, partial [Planctomycetaceae bacterium]|nr:hypothetical protein [Planctomycetaceae bacterium]
ILSDAQKQQIKSRDDVVAGATGVNAKIDLLGFEMDPEENQASRAEFLAISSQTGGAYYPAVSADALLSVLQQILGPSEFSVTDRSLKTSEPIPFGQSVDLDLSNSSPQSFGVTVDRTTEQIQVREGERIRMYFDRKESRLFVKPYLNERVENASLLSRPEISIGFHTPRRVPDHEDHVRFRCSLSLEEDQFLSRPESVVVRVTALKADGSETENVWYAFNPLFATDVSVPVVEFVAEDWPQDFTRARVEFWASWETIEPEDSRPLEEYLNSSETIDLPMRDRPIFARESPEQNGTYYLIENFSESAPIDNPFLMNIVSNDPESPLRWRVRHRFDRIRGVHLQEMIPERASSGKPAELQVELRSFEGIIRRSLTTAKPAELEVQPAGTILQPTSH